MLEKQFAVLGDSAAAHQMGKAIQNAIQSDASVLLLGPSGTLTEKIAKTIHDKSMRSRGPWAVVHCSMLSIEEFEEMHARFENAQGGTVFFDELTEIPLSMQIRLASLIQSNPSIRVIAATHVSLEDAASEGLLNGSFANSFASAQPIQIEALKNRREDIPAMIAFYIEKYNQMMNAQVNHPQGTVFEALCQYDWPGNEKELQSLIERIVLTKKSGAIELADLPRRVFQQYADRNQFASGAMAAWDFPKMNLPEKGLDLKQIVSSFENHLVDQALARTSGNKNRASMLLGLNRTTLVEKLRKRGMIIPLKANGSEETNDEVRIFGADN